MEGMSTFDKKLRRATWSRRTGRAFIIEALILFAFLIASLAVITQVFVASVSESAYSRDLEHAITIASNTAERFSANPLSDELNYSQDGLTVTCEVDSQPTGAGTLYIAHIIVYNDRGAFFDVDTTRYVNGVS